MAGKSAGRRPVHAAKLTVWPTDARAHLPAVMFARDRSRPVAGAAWQVGLCPFAAPCCETKRERHHGYQRRHDGRRRKDAACKRGDGYGAHDRHQARILAVALMVGLCGPVAGHLGRLKPLDITPDLFDLLAKLVQFGTQRRVDGIGGRCPPGCGFFHRLFGNKTGPEGPVQSSHWSLRPPSRRWHRDRSDRRRSRPWRPYPSAAALAGSAVRMSR